MKKTLDKYRKNLYFAFAKKTKSMILLFVKNLEVFLLDFERFCKDLRRKCSQSVDRKRFSSSSYAIGGPNRSVLC